MASATAHGVLQRAEGSVEDIPNELIRLQQRGRDMEDDEDGDGQGGMF